jgi:hypothetical protein
MSYCEDEALHFDSAIAVDQIEPELVLAILQSAPVAAPLTFRWRATVLWDDCIEIVEGESDLLLPPARAPPREWRTLYGSVS